VRSELNGRDSFSANGGRSLNFEDVPPELMAGVDIYKNPSAEQIEGAVGGLVNLRTAMPFDFKGRKVAVSLPNTYSELKKGKWSPSARDGLGPLEDRLRRDRRPGRPGLLGKRTRTDAFQVEPYYPRTDARAGKTVWVPKGSQWRTLEFNRKREGHYGALQWKKDDWFLADLLQVEVRDAMGRAGDLRPVQPVQHPGRRRAPPTIRRARC
jgi:iron complex outermembrane receptor protein